ECLGLPSRPVEREHQLRTKSLPQRVLLDERLELADERPMPTERQLGLEAVFERREPQFFEARYLRLRERLERDVGERLAAPELERLSQPRRSLLRIALVEPRPSLVG